MLRPAGGRSLPAGPTVVCRSPPRRAERGRRSVAMSSPELAAPPAGEAAPPIGKSPLVSDNLSPITRAAHHEPRVHDDVASATDPAKAPPRCAPACAQKMSAMEEESVRERLRSRLLRQCADLLLAQDAAASAAAGIAPRFARDAFRRLFQEKVRLRAISVLSGSGVF